MIAFDYGDWLCSERQAGECGRHDGRIPFGFRTIRSKPTEWIDRLAYPWTEDCGARAIIRCRLSRLSIMKRAWWKLSLRFVLRPTR